MGNQSYEGGFKTGILDKFFKRKKETSNEKQQLIQNLKDKNIFVRKEAAEILDRLGWKPGDDKEKAYYLIAKKDSVMGLRMEMLKELKRFKKLID